MTPRGWRLVLLAFFSAVLALFILAPAACPCGSVTGLNGRPVEPDYFDLWASLPAVPRLAYSVGDILCHQEAARSFAIDGNQLPICARDISALAGMVAGFAQCLSGRARSVSERICIPFLAVSFALMIADVVVQGNLGLNVFITRVITGGMCGIAVAFAIDRWISRYDAHASVHKVYK